MGSVNHYDPQLIDLFGAGDCSPEADVLQGTDFFGGGVIKSFFCCLFLLWLESLWIQGQSCESSKLGKKI